ncbi:MAG: T9SS C-terminal target domain-containing protein [Flavobacteriales bacterium]|nr:T9SS C-terminal target domain-containing protein [Crocinitomicaceae bacterium]NBX80684.1 T9SS C-terminal target domain-containing protein [Flavobacteriales bacterium]NCA21587.1 T9SS C-terminal target domain-containing protein [Crocinitomicaceae bacterium]
MKKILLSIALLVGITSANAQETPVGTVVGNFTLTDLNGTSHTLFDYLDAGKMVVIDVSATWCGPCWGYHNTNALNDFYNAKGPNGTNEAMVFFIEGDATTPTTGLSGGANGSGNPASQGDWITGEDMPIIDLTTAASFENSGLNIAYFPVMYVICPNRTVYKSGVAGSIGTLALLNSYIGGCPAPATASPDVTMMSYDTDTYICNGSSHTPEVTIQNNSTTNLTNATVTITQGGNTVSTGTYSGNLASYGVATVTCTPIANPSSGALIATVTTTDDILATNGIISTSLTIYTAAAAPLVQDFTSTAFPYSEYKVSSTSGNNWTYEAGTMKYDCYNYANGSKGDLSIEPVNLSSLTDPSLSFDVAYRGYTAATPENDKLEVFVSTNCGTTWTSVYNKQGTALSTGAPQTASFTPATAADWRTETVSLATFAGQSEVFIKYVGTSNYGNNLYIDNINVESATSVGENELASTSVYPNPASTIVNVAFEGNGGDYTITITDLVGRIVSNTISSNANGATKTELSIADLNTGNYLVTISNGTSKFTQSLIVK